MLSFEIRRFLVVSAVFFAVSKALVWAMPSVTVDGDETQPWTGFPWNRLAVGLHLKSDGAWSSESDAFYSMEPMEAKHYVVSRFSQDYKSYPTLLFKKLIRLYNTENGIKYWMSQVSDLSTTGRFALMMDGWFVLLQVVFAFGLVEVLRLLIRGQTSHQLLLSLWMLIGFSCVVTLFEFQNRYRTAWYPIYFLIMPYGVILLGRIATAVKRRLRGAV